MTGIKNKIVLAFLPLMMGLTSCSNENLLGGAVGDNQSAVITIFASTEDQESTRTSLSGNDASGYQVLWSEGDEITAIGADERPYQLTLSEGAGKTSGVFTSSEPMPDGNYKLFYGTDGSLLPRIQQYMGDGVISNAPMFTSVSVIGGDVPATQFKNLCGLLRLTLKGNDTIKRINISSDEDMSGMIYVKDDGTISFVRNKFQDVSLDFGEGVELSAEGTDFYIALPPAEYHGVKIEFVPAEGETITKTLKAGKTLNIARALITPVSISLLPPTPKPDVLSGVFSVSSSKKVHFSKGNLQATKNSGSGYSWGFANEQYQFVGAKAGNTTIDNQATGSIVDLFCFSSEKNYFGISTSESNSVYSGNLKDWGKAIDSEGTWFTLSLDEWKYLFGNNTARKDKYGSATVCGVKGLLFVPDVFNDPMTNKGSEAFVPRSGNAAWNANVYSGNDWTSMEDAGAVFLPTAGYRFYDSWDTHATMVGNVGSICFYWSSSIESTSWLPQGYIIEYGEDKDIKEDSKARCTGHSVRLVTKVNQ